jgi:hypothetical protein
MTYDQEWMNAGYRQGMGSAKFLPPPDRNRIRAYHLMSPEHGISSISLRRIKVARISELNDPFELMALNTRLHEIRRLVERFKRLQNDKTGLLCFSRNWTNPLLWSHYAANHEGICLGFDLSPGEDVEDVSYSDERPQIENSAASITAKDGELLLRTKYKDWNYEDELRKFVDLATAKPEHGLFFVPFNAELELKEVILGQRNEFSIESIRELVESRNPGAVVFKTRLERGGFRIVGDGRYPPKVPMNTA